MTTLAPLLLFLLFFIDHQSKIHAYKIQPNFYPIEYLNVLFTDNYGMPGEGWLIDILKEYIKLNQKTIYAPYQYDL